MSKSKKNNVRLSGTIDSDVYEALEQHCRAHPNVSRSGVMARALRQFLFPEHQEERERVLTENLDRLYWHQHNQADRANRELRIVREMLALFVRTFYNHTPEVPASEQRAAAESGEARFDRFLKALADHIGPETSALERMPEPGTVTADEVPAPEAPEPPDSSEASKDPEPSGAQAASATPAGSSASNNHQQEKDHAQVVPRE